MKLKFENLNKPSNRKWKFIADYLLYVALPAINIFFVTLQPVNTKFSLYGDSIPEVTDNSIWAGLTTGALCAYDNDWNYV